MVLVEHEVQLGLLSGEHRVPAMVKERILVEVRVLVAVDFDKEVPYDLLRRDCQQLWLGPLVPGRVLTAVVEEAHQLPHIVVVFLYLCFCLFRATGRG